MGTQGYIPALDGIRAISVFIVLVAHSGFGDLVPGGLGVTVFFFLSGFLITTLLDKEFHATGRVHIGHFFLRRAFRLFPPLALVLFLSYSLCILGIIDGGASLQGLFYQLFYLANYHIILNLPGETPEGLGILWSLAVEEHFYLAFPFLFHLLRKHTSKQSTIAILVATSILILLWRMFLVHAHDAPAYRTYYGTDTRIDSILYGCLLALSFNPTKIKTTQIPSLKAIVLIFSGLTLLLFTLLYREENFRQTFRYSLQGIALMPLFFYAVALNKSMLFSWLNVKFLRTIGVYSYFIYLSHHVIIGGIKFNELTDNRYLILISSAFLSICFAYSVDKYIDPYFRKLRKSYR